MLLLVKWSVSKFVSFAWTENEIRVILPSIAASISPSNPVGSSDLTNSMKAMLGFRATALESTNS
jgi:hypothetical protein